MEGIKRIRILDVPIDILDEDRLEEVLLACASDGRHHRICLVTSWDLVRAWFSREQRALYETAALVLPVSIGIIGRARFLRRELPVRYLPFDLVIRILGILEAKGKSIYLLGTERAWLQKAEQNIRGTFPGLRVVGRYTGYYPRDMERTITTAIQKAAPVFILAGRGLRGGEKWLFRNRQNLPSGLCLWEPHTLDVMAGQSNRIDRETFRRGREWRPGLARRPWRLLRGFAYCVFAAALLIARLKKL
jgi:N-acetylglucosaminyldiphosphoundecaprenol N-acetyl-beta-D-mannosaminyltransferase